MSDFGIMYSITSLIILSIALFVVVAIGYNIAVSNNQSHGHHLVDRMAGDEGED